MHRSIGGTGQGLGEGAAWGWGGKEKGTLERSRKTKQLADSGVGTRKGGRERVGALHQTPSALAAKHGSQAPCGGTVFLPLEGAMDTWTCPSQTHICDPSHRHIADPKDPPHMRRLPASRWSSTLSCGTRRFLYLRTCLAPPDGRNLLANTPPIAVSVLGSSACSPHSLLAPLPKVNAHNGQKTESEVASWGR